jgi:hypothetical protein
MLQTAELQHRGQRIQAWFSANRAPGASQQAEQSRPRWPWPWHAGMAADDGVGAGSVAIIEYQYLHQSMPQHHPVDALVETSGAPSIAAQHVLRKQRPCPVVRQAQ